MNPSSIQPSYIEKIEIANDFPEYGINVLHDKSKDNYLFVLCPIGGMDIKNCTRC